MAPSTAGPDHAFELTISNDDAGVYALWQAEPGVYPRVKDKLGSSMYILSGDAIVYDADGTPHEIHEGSTLVLPYRWEGRWEILRTCRKVFAYAHPQGEPETSPTKARRLDGIEALHGELEEPLPASVHLGALPDASARIVSSGVDGITAIVGLDEGEVEVSGSTRAAHCFIITGEVELRDAEGAWHRLPQGVAFTLPIGWKGTWRTLAPVRLYVAFVAPSPEASD